MTMSPSRDDLAESRGDADNFDKSSKTNSSIPGQRDLQAPEKAVNTSGSPAGGPNHRPRSLDEQTATDIAAGW